MVFKAMRLDEITKEVRIEEQRPPPPRPHNGWRGGNSQGKQGAASEGGEPGNMESWNPGRNTIDTVSAVDGPNMGTEKEPPTGMSLGLRAGKSCPLRS